MDKIINILQNNWIVALLAALVVWIVGAYNRLVKAKILVEKSWSDIDTLLKKRFDLIPNLIETVKGYANYEQSTFKEVTEARNKAGQLNIDIKNATPEELLAFQQAQSELSKSLGKLFALSEAYPDLKANENFLDLQNQLKEIETEINLARRMYNGAVGVYNTAIQTVPTNIIARIFNFGEKTFFEADEEERKNVKVNFDEFKKGSESKEK